MSLRERPAEAPSSPPSHSLPSSRNLRFLLLDSWKEEVVQGTGTTVGISNRVRGLRALGHEVTVLGLPPGRGPFLLRRILFNVRLPHRLAKHVAAHPPHVVVGFDVDGFRLRKTSICRNRPNPADDGPSTPGPQSTGGASPFVVELKGVAADEARYATGLDRAQLLLLAALERRNAQNAHLVVVPSRYSADVVRRYYQVEPERLTVVPEGIDLDAWEEPPSRHGPSDSPPTILSVGHQYPRKNTVTLLRAHRRVLARLPDARLRIVGGGPELPRLRREARELGVEARVTFLGPVPSHEQVREEYRRAHCFCLPSLQEGFGIVFLEAMAAGLPVVGPDRGAPPEVLGEAGLTVPPEESSALARALIQVLTSPALREDMARRGLRRVRRYDYRTVARAYHRRLVEHLFGPGIEGGPEKKEETTCTSG